VRLSVRNNAYNDARTTATRLAAVVDSAIRAVAITNKTVAAYRAAGDVAADAYVNWELALDRQSVADAENSAKYVRGLWMTRRTN
jgi:hypothetical protein